MLVFVVFGFTIICTEIYQPEVIKLKNGKLIGKRDFTNEAKYDCVNFLFYRHVIKRQIGI